MATIYTRAGKGSALTWTEGDDNITNLNNDKIEAVVEDITPQLGGNLDVNDNKIIAGTSGSVEIEAANTQVTVSATRHVQFFEFNLGDEETPDLYTTMSAEAGGRLLIAGGEVTIGTESNSAILLASGANANISLAPNGTGKTVANRINYSEAIHSLGTTSGTIAPNAANGNIQTITLNGNLTINAFTSPVSGQTITLIITTGGTGRTLTSSMLFAGGEKTLSTTNTTDILTITYIGTTYYASLVKDYK
jgi:hypothetical protein